MLEYLNKYYLYLYKLYLVGCIESLGLLFMVPIYNSHSGF